MFIGLIIWSAALYLCNRPLSPIIQSPISRKAHLPRPDPSLMTHASSARAFRPRSRRHPSLAAAAFAAALILTLSPADAQTTRSTNATPPQLVQTEPAAWSTSVRPSLRRVLLQFDQPMRPGFTDWIGRRSLMPAEFTLDDHISPDLRSQWLDVSLEPGRVYVFALNERGRRGVGFQNQRGVAMEPHFLVFRTSGQMLAEHSPPQVVSTSPEHQASDVDPALFTGISVTFDRPMMTDDHGFIVAVNNQLLRLDEIEFEWNDEATTCLLRLPLLPQSRYRVILNSQRNIGFRATNRAPLWPVQLSFQTTDASAPTDPAVPAANVPPELVLTSPAMWEQDVEPGPQRLILSFDQPLRPGFTDWMGRNQRGSFRRQTTDEDQARDEGMSDDQMSVWLEVDLQPGTLYVFPLNERGRRGVGFQNARGLVMEPRYLVFRTAGPVNPADVSPEVESTNPVNGSTDLEAARLGAVTVIFNKSMRRDQHGATLLAGDEPVELGDDDWNWSADGSAFSITHDWQPATEYRLLLNSDRSIGFANQAGTPLWATELRFTTAEDPDADPDADQELDF